MASAPADLQRLKMSRIDRLNRSEGDECADGCNQTWLNQAEDFLRRNKINKARFTTAMYDLLRNGPAKYKNLLLIGPSNCGKTFLFAPLTLIFRCFSNPACNHFEWIGVEEAEVVLLNNFRWNAKVNNFIFIALLYQLVILCFTSFLFICCGCSIFVIIISLFLLFFVIGRLSGLFKNLFISMVYLQVLLLFLQIISWNDFLLNARRRHSPPASTQDTLFL